MEPDDIRFLMWLLDRPHLPGQEDAQEACKQHAKLCRSRATWAAEGNEHEVKPDPDPNSEDEQGWDDASLRMNIPHD